MAARNSQQVVEVVAVPSTVAARVSQLAVEVVIKQAGVAQSVKGKTKGATPLRVPTTGSVALRANTYALLTVSGDGEGAAELFNAAGVSQGAMTQDVAASNAGHVHAYILRSQITAAGDYYAVFTMPSGGASAGILMEIDGIDPTSPLDKTAAATGSGTSPSSGATEETTQAYELAIGVIGTEGPESDNPGSWSNSFQAGPRVGSTGAGPASNNTAAEGYSVISATGAYTAAKTGITSRQWAAVIATYKGALPSAPAPEPVDITTASLPDGQAGAEYAEFLEALGGTLPYSFAVTSGALPDGLSLASDGAITGTPTTAGTATFTVTATDNASPAQTDAQELSIEIAAAPEPEPEGATRLTPGSQGSPLATGAADRVTDGSPGSPFVRGTYSGTTRTTPGTQGSPITRSTS